MIWRIRNISLIFWLTTIIVIPIAFIILPGLIGVFPGVNPIVFISVFFIFVGSVVSLLNHLLVRRIIFDLIREGQVWERSGITHRAEKKYNRAIRVFDSFLFWPFRTGPVILHMVKTVARFQLNSGIENENFKLAVTTYLKINPLDKDISRLWLKQLRNAGIITTTEQEVLSLLAENHETDEKLLPLVADILLGLGRSDFMARKVYNQILQLPMLKGRYENRISSLIGHDKEERYEDDIILSKSVPSERRMQTIFYHMGSAINNLFKTLGKVKIIAILFKSLIVKFIKWFGNLVSFILLNLVRAVEFFKIHDQVRFYIKAGCLVLISGWLIYFMVGTITHLHKPAPKKPEQKPVVEQIPKPFTIQVAAYLKQKHADRYVAELKGQGLDARIKKVAGGGKTWYVVRVSSFADKESAAEYGRRLKQEQVIDDFFVSNK